MPQPILFFESHSGFFDGAQQSLWLLLPHLDRRRFRPIFAGPEAGPLAEKLAAAGVETRIVRPHARLRRYGGVVLREGGLGRARLVASSLAYGWRLRRLIREEGIRLVHCNSIRSLLTIGPAARTLGVPLVWHLRLNLELGRWNRLGLWLADRVIVVSDSLRAGFPTGPGDPRKFVTVYNGLDVEAFSPDGDADAVRQELGIEPGWRAVGTTGTLTTRKGQLDLLRAASSVIAAHPRTRFVIVGDAQGDETYAARLRAHVAEAGLDRHVVFTGWRSDVARVLRGLDLFVLPSLNEGLPRAILEAMALSLPVVATRVGGNAELVVDGVTGLLVPAQAPEALAAAITQLLDEPERGRAMGRQGRARVETRFSLEASVRGVEAVIESLLDSGRDAHKVRDGGGAEAPVLRS